MNLQINNLLLEGKNKGYTSVNGILKPTLSFILEYNGNPIMITYRKLGQELGSITDTKNLVDSCKMSKSFFMAEVRGKDTPLGTFSSPDFANTTWRTSFGHDLLVVLRFF